MHSHGIDRDVLAQQILGSQPILWCQTGVVKLVYFGLAEHTIPDSYFTNLTLKKTLAVSRSDPKRCITMLGNDLSGVNVAIDECPIYEDVSVSRVRTYNMQPYPRLDWIIRVLEIASNSFPGSVAILVEKVKGVII